MLTLTVLGFLAAGIGVMGGLGGAVLLVPALVLTGTPPVEASALGLLSVSAGSLAAAADHIDRGLVNHRLAITVELFASTGAVAGALAAGAMSASGLKLVLAGAAAIAGVATFIGRDPAASEHPAFAAEACGEWPGVLGGAYPEGETVIPYSATNVGRSMALMGFAGVVAGMSGTSGGYIKTPVMNRMMGVPVKVAGATTTMTVGITAAAALIVRLGVAPFDARKGAAVIVGSVIGGQLGAAAAKRVPTRFIRTTLTVVLFVAAAVVAIR